MNKISIAIALALALALALPIAGSPTANADPNYVIRFDTKLWQHSFARGHVRCQIKKDDRVYRDWGENWSKWIYVSHYKYVRDWGSYVETGCRGWLDKNGHDSH